MSYRPRLKDKYNSEIVKTLTDKFGYKSTMRVPKLTKIVLSQGMGDAVADKKLIDSAVADLSKIAGQKAITTISKKDISNFQIKKRNAYWNKSTLERRQDV
jgi:large subunit ribosomal protein L5